MRACGNCHSNVPDGQDQCPRCGTAMPRGFFAALLGAVFGRRAEQPATASESSAPSSSASRKPFAFEVEDVFSITGRGTVATGRVSRGSIAVGDEIAFQSPKGERVQRRIAGIEAFRKVVKVANEGETVGLLLAQSVPFDVLVRGVVFERA